MRRILLILAFLGYAAAVWPQDSREDRLKAAALFDFLRFVQWPPRVAPAAGAPLPVCVAGRDDFVSALRDYTAGRTLDGHPVYVHAVLNLRTAAECRVVFVTAQNHSQWNGLLGAVRGHDVLTVGFSPGFADQGGVVAFSLRDGSPHFRINLRAAAEQGVQISSSLMSLSEIVGN